MLRIWHSDVETGLCHNKETLCILRLECIEMINQKYGEIDGTDAEETTMYQTGPGTSCPCKMCYVLLQQACNILI